MTMTTTSTTPVRLRDMQPLGVQDVKDQAKRLRPQLAEHGLELGNSQVLHMMARAHGFKNWHELKAHLERQEQQARVGLQLPHIPRLDQAMAPFENGHPSPEESEWRAKLAPWLNVPAGSSRHVTGPLGADHHLGDGRGWQYAYKDIGSYFDPMTGPIAVIDETFGTGGLASDLLQQMVDKAPNGSAHVLELGHADGSDMAKLEYVLESFNPPEMAAVDTPMFLSIPWVYGNWDSYQALLGQAKDLNIQVILRVMPKDFLEAMTPERELALCRATILAPKTRVPTMPHVMPVDNDRDIPAIWMP
jgi:hypothetical protein